MENTNVNEKNGVAVITPKDKVIKALAEKGITENLIAEIAKYDKLKVTASIDEAGNVLSNKEQLKEVTEAWRKVRDTEVLIKDLCKEQRDEWTALSRENLALQNAWVAITNPVKNYLAEQKALPENLKKQYDAEQVVKQEEAFKARVIELEALGIQSKDFGNFYALNDLSIASVDLKFMPESGYQSFLNQVKDEAAKIKAEEDRIAAEKKAEEDRIAKVKAEQEAEAKRLDAIAKEQAEKQRQIEESQARIDAEKKRIADEKQAAEQAQIREQELIKAREEARVKAIQDEKERVERERIAAEAKAKADEAARIEAEKKAAELAAKKEARKPDKKRLTEWLAALNLNTPPAMKTEEGENVRNELIELFSKFEIASHNKIETL